MACLGIARNHDYISFSGVYPDFSANGGGRKGNQKRVDLREGAGTQTKVPQKPAIIHFFLGGGVVSY